MVSGYSSSQIDSIFLRAKENFETHNDSWKNDEGSYPRISNREWRNQIFAFISTFLDTADLSSFVSALQDISSRPQTAAFLKNAIEEQKVTRHYFADGHFVPHIVTLWDQLEELVQDANFNFNLRPAPLSFHVGVNFELTVVKSRNIPYDMWIQKYVAIAGMNAAKLAGQFQESANFKNMLENYDGLEEISNNGDILIFQRLYQALYDATPPGDRDRDATHNHMAALFHMNNIGFFQGLSMALASAKAQGHMDVMVSGLLGLTRLIGPNDIEPLRETLQALLQQPKGGGPAPLDILLQKIAVVQASGKGYENFKDAFFHLVPALVRLNVKPTGYSKPWLSWPGTQELGTTVWI
ncbi:unnamed protein product [Sphagnum balticum]